MTSEKYPVSDWLYEVANRDTNLGYIEWREHQIEMDEGSKSPHQGEPE